MIRTVSLCAGALLAAVATANAQTQLCINGHLASQRPDVTYGGLPPKPGYELNHIIPLCLGGPDARINIQYQPHPEARLKDVRERHVCEAVCRGDISLDNAMALFHREWP
jgi:hypothetical protein